MVCATQTAQANETISSDYGVLNELRAMDTLKNNGTISGSEYGVFNYDGSIGTLDNTFWKYRHHGPMINRRWGLPTPL